MFVCFNHNEDLGFSSERNEEPLGGLPMAAIKVLSLIFNSLTMWLCVIFFVNTICFVFWVLSCLEISELLGFMACCLSLFLENFLPLFKYFSALCLLFPLGWRLTSCPPVIYHR